MEAVVFYSVALAVFFAVAGVAEFFHNRFIRW